MKKYLLHIVLFFCITQQLFSQDDGVVAFNMPARNSLKFNRQFINPTFSFVREQNKYISFNNKKEWAQFDNAPQTYLFAYSGRFRENIGAGVSLFQQNYGVLSAFGGVANVAYNAVLDRDSNLTFGMNLAFYKSGINEGNVVTNYPDPSFNNIPSNSIITINPGINYGTEFLDFGLSVKNLVSYNLTSSKMIEDNPEQSFQGHIMYTGYMNSRGFFDESRFTGLISTELRKEQTVIGAMAMLMVPKGIWVQGGYNSLYALSAGIGLNISPQIVIEYNYEKGVGGFSTFGNSHDFTLAYKFNSRTRYDYSGDDDEEALLMPSNSKRKPIVKRRNTSGSKSLSKKVNVTPDNTKTNKVNTTKVKNAQKEESVTQVKAAQEEQTRKAEAARVQAEADAKAKELEASRLKAAQEEQTRKAEAARVQAEADAKAKELEASRLKAAQEEQTRIAEAARIQAEADAKAKELEALRLKAVQEEQTRIAEAARVQAEALETEDKERIDEATESLKELEKVISDTANQQSHMLNQLSDKVASKQQDLNDLKEENDLSEQGIISAPKAFKSVSAENAIIEDLKLKINNSIEFGNAKITEIEKLYRDRLKKVKSKDDVVIVAYSNALQKLKSEQLQSQNMLQNLMLTLDDIKVATDYERRRRIKRAAYDNEDDRYFKDRATLERIKKFTKPSSEPLTSADFNFGEALSNIQIVKNVNKVEEGYYLVLAVHTDVAERDAFLEKAVAAGQTDINFFFDVNTSKYYIYYEKYDGIGEAKSALDKNKGTKPYNSKMAMVKIEN
jgi:type IX secretion system PorP/SprF family membrane protein